MTNFLLIIRFFPYDASIDVPLTRLHLPLIYGFTWAIHLIYVGYIVMKWRGLARAAVQKSDGR